MNLTAKHIAAVLVLECRTCGHWLTAHRTGVSPDKEPVFFCIGNDAPASNDYGTCEKCPASKPVRFGNLMIGPSR